MCSKNLALTDLLSPICFEAEVLPEFTVNVGSQSIDTYGLVEVFNARSTESPLSLSLSVELIGVESNDFQGFVETTHLVEILPESYGSLTGGTLLILDDWPCATLRIPPLGTMSGRIGHGKGVFQGQD